MKPSIAALKAAMKHLPEFPFTTERALQAAYDVDFAALQLEVEQLAQQVKEAEESEERICRKLQLSHENCACDYEQEGDTCMTHFPSKKRLDKTIADLQAEIERLNKMRAHCPDCGADFMATGIEAGCPCKLRAEVERLRKATEGTLA